MTNIKLSCKHCNSNSWILSKNEHGSLFIKCSVCGYEIVTNRFCLTMRITELLEGIDDK